MTETAKIINCTSELVWFYNLNTKLRMVTITNYFLFYKKIRGWKKMVESVKSSLKKWEDPSSDGS